MGRQFRASAFRAARAPALAALDLQVLRAWEEGKTPADVADVMSRKQQLRDITKRVDQASSWEELTAIVIE